MRQSARQIADHASFQAFMNSYLKEVDPGVWHQANHWQQQTDQTLSATSHQVLELKLPSQHITLAVGVSYRSQVGRHTLTEVFQKPLHQFDWQALDFFSAILLLIKELYAPAPGHPQSDQQRKKELELLARLIESQQVMTRYLEQRLDDPKLRNLNFIDSEQSILFGHWLHPTPKSRQGIHDWQHQDYSPELCGEFQLHYFSVDRALIEQGSILSQSAEAILQQILTQQSTAMDTLSLPLSEDRLLIPTHPLQAQWLLHQDYIQQRIASGEIQDIGPLGAKFTPTSSVRTLYSEQLDFMVKLSIPVKVTNSMRINMHHELEAGIVVANLLRTSQFSHKYPRFQTIDDPAYVSVTLPEREESGFELIIRENPFSRCQPNADQLSVISLAALTQDGITEDQPSRLSQLIHQLADNQQKEQQRPIAQVAAQWLEHYWQCAIEPAIRLYDEYGIALEAHQQNSLLDVTDGLPSRYFYRDNQGFYLSNAHKTALLAMEPQLANTPELFYDDEMILNRFSYYLIVNQLFSVINRLGIDQLLPEHQALELCVGWLAILEKQLTGQGKRLVESLLSQRDIAFKGNLLTRIHDVDELQADQELAVYTKIKNPFRAIAFAQGVVTSETDSGQRLDDQGTATAAHTLHLNALISASERGSATHFSDVSETTGGQRESA
ncbi:IucA/IucC family protein [Litoribrevibacter albus]|uniref:Petrobactin biosynthesis protein AsbA n=1 Tax=Litoribrevibacter albus TaxID=1473156 RepID=A0AA37W9M8_9GAMM|nr:IucA/IucC family protein [Litoribrevibacter albus]GLQ32861.1 petrobactin biosynthesis protein AsbA [Litoribrevibacter albus]